MRILVTGSTGLINSALVARLKAGGDEIIRLVCSMTPGDREVRWNPAYGIIDEGGLEGADAVVHLAGENIASGRWTERKKARIRDSRIDGTRLLSATLARMEQPPKVLICSSAVGYYGNRGDEILDEKSPSGAGFLADVCRAWEAAAEPARQRGIRVAHLRTGVGLSRKGGALAKMLIPFRLCLGGVVGSGQQYMSWIALEDIVSAIVHVMKGEGLSGPFNCVSPNPVTNAEFTKTLGTVLHRPTVLPMPAGAARLAFGEMGDELLLSSQRVLPRRLQETGFQFKYPDLESALRHELNS